MDQGVQRLLLAEGEQAANIATRDSQLSGMKLCDGDEIEDRVDRYNLESRSWLHQDQPGM
jgi:hypothetical protein